MKLLDYMTATGTKEEEAAAALGVSQATINRWKLGRCIPHRDQFAAIERFTDGQVTVADFFSTNTLTTERTV